MNISKDLNDIGNLMKAATLLTAIRQEVLEHTKDKKAQVLGGKFARVENAKSYDVVVVLHGKEDTVVLARRIKANHPDLEVNKLGSVVDNVLGIRQARRTVKAEKVEDITKKIIGAN